jgi:mRNA interferase RelE/StbE
MLSLNTNYQFEFSPEAEKDMEKFNNFQKDQIDKAIRKVSKNPLPQNEGGYGKPLGHKHGVNLTGCCKIVLKRLGIRVVYKLIRTDELMLIIVVAARSDSEVYDIAANRIAEREVAGD